MKILSFVQKKLNWLVPGAMVLGLLYGNLSDPSWLKGLVPVVTVLMIFPMMIGLNVKTLLRGCNLKLQAVTQGINFVVVPIIGFLVGKIFLADYPLMAAGLIFISILPTSGMTVSWTGIAGGNVKSAIKMTVIALLLGAVLVPFYASFLIGGEVEVSMIAIVKQILTFILLPLILGMITRFLIIGKTGEEKFKEKIKPMLGSVSSLGVLFMVFMVMALKAKMIVVNPGIVLQLLVPLIVFYSLIYLISTLVTRKLFSKEDAIASVFGVSMRNLAIALAISITTFGEKGAEIALIIAVAFMLQPQSAVWYIRLINKIFPKKSL